MKRRGSKLLFTVITWVLMLVSYFELNFEIAGAVALIWGAMLMTHVIKLIGGEK